MLKDSDPGRFGLQAFETPTGEIVVTCNIDPRMPLTMVKNGTDSLPGIGEDGKYHVLQHQGEKYIYEFGVDPLNKASVVITAEEAKWLADQNR